MKNLLHQLKYGLLPALLLLTIILIAVGGNWLYLIPVLVVSFGTWIDELMGDLGTNPELNPTLMNFWLVACVPLLLIMTLMLAAIAGSSSALDPVFAVFGFDFQNSRENMNWPQFISAIFGAGLFIGAGAVNIAHELTHRNNRFLNIVSRWLLAFTFDTTFSIEHVHGHHRYVGTPRDPATARRGEYVLAFALRSTIGQFIAAFKFEAARMKRRNLPVVSYHNRAIRGQFMSLALLVLHFLVAGWPGVLMFVLLGIQGKAYLEIVNYVEHYGLVRVEGTSIEPRHSWNCDRVISNTLLFNLPRHSHHHKYASKPFWELDCIEGGPLLPYGYKMMMLIALVPSLWNATLEPLLDKWEAELATPEEREAMRERKSEIGLLPQAAE